VQPYVAGTPCTSHSPKRFERHYSQPTGAWQTPPGYTAGLKYCERRPTLRAAIRMVLLTLPICDDIG
jgi:hypothetical protein